MTFDTNIEDLLATAIYETLSEDGTLVDLLGTYQNATCIFSQELVPELAPRPYVWISAALKNKAHDTKTSFGRDVSVDIHCVTNNTRSAKTVNAIAAQVRALLHRVTLTLDDQTKAVIATASGGISIPSDESVSVRGLTINYTIM